MLKFLRKIGIHWYSKKDLVVFGNYLLSEERNEQFHDNNFEFKNQVNDVDFDNCGL